MYLSSSPGSTRSQVVLLFPSFFPFFGCLFSDFFLSPGFTCSQAFPCYQVLLIWAPSLFPGYPIFRIPHVASCPCCQVLLVFVFPIAGFPSASRFPHFQVLLVPKLPLLSSSAYFELPPCFRVILSSEFLTLQAALVAKFCLFSFFPLLGFLPLLGFPISRFCLFLSFPYYQALLILSSLPVSGLSYLQNSSRCKLPLLPSSACFRFSHCWVSFRF